MIMKNNTLYQLFWQFLDLSNIILSRVKLWTISIDVMKTLESTVMMESGGELILIKYGEKSRSKCRTTLSKEGFDVIKGWNHVHL